MQQLHLLEHDSLAVCEYELQQLNLLAVSDESDNIGSDDGENFMGRSPQLQHRKVSSTPTQMQHLIKDRSLVSSAQPTCAPIAVASPQRSIHEVTTTKQIETVTWARLDSATVDEIRSTFAESDEQHHKIPDNSRENTHNLDEDEGQSITYDLRSNLFPISEGTISGGDGTEDGAAFEFGVRSRSSSLGSGERSSHRRFAIGDADGSDCGSGDNYKSDGSISMCSSSSSSLQPSDLEQLQAELQRLRAASESARSKLSEHPWASGPVNRDEI